ncbi:MAG: hypothetical protein ABJL72_04280 [Roseobacter sp.]
MRLLDPETFEDQPYVAGLNQGGHLFAGAAIFAATFSLFDMGFGVLCALLIPLVLEIWQYTKRAAKLWDSLLDLFFWYIGAIAWIMAVLIGDVSGKAILFPLWSVFIMGCVMAVFTFFKSRSKGTE